ncbi:MAG: hypothetical protein D4R64_09005 [Porphyromonadaceae bacterium]|nr:MAG: hypothetical protein D4R64_09005 [Porphyromonadaceae bacterium]
MKSISIRLLFILMIGAILSCDKIWPGGDEPVIIDTKPGGILDMAFVYRVQGIPPGRLKKVDLCLAYTADNLYRGIFFVQANVSDAVTHYRFELPPGDYFYYATVICLCGGDSCKYSGFPGQNGLIAAGGKVTVEDGKINSYTTIFH